jgi:hypothetical protein
MSRNHRLRAVAIIALGVASAACESGTEPLTKGEFDAEAALADFNALEATFESPDLAGFQALGGRTPFGAAPASIDAIAGLTAPSAQDSGRRFVTDLARDLAATLPRGADGPQMGPIISGWNRGTTFVYDAEADDYAPDLTRTDAPETGVRFITYAVDSAGAPIVDQETGYADLIDEGDGSVEDIVLRLRVVHRSETVLDYRTTLDRRVTGGVVTIDGFLVGDGLRLDFDLGVVAADSADITLLEVTFDLAVESRGFSIEGKISGIEEGTDGGDGKVDLTVRHRQDSVRIALSGIDGLLEGTVYVNGDTFATVSGPEEDPTFVGSTGEPLTWAEFQVLQRVVSVVEDVFTFIEDLVGPVKDLILLGIVL